MCISELINLFVRALPSFACLPIWLSLSSSRSHCRQTLVFTSEREREKCFGQPTSLIACCRRHKVKVSGSQDNSRQTCIYTFLMNTLLDSMGARSQRAAMIRTFHSCLERCISSLHMLKSGKCTCARADGGEGSPVLPLGALLQGALLQGALPQLCKALWW